jgi:hypothetical protein
MRLPVKLTNLPFLGLRRPVNPALLCDADHWQIEFDRAVSAVKIDGVWKTTRHTRQPLTDELIVSFVAATGPCGVLEIGASSGVASATLLDSLGSCCDRFIISDKCLKLRYKRVGGRTCFYHPVDSRCIMAMGRYWIAYEDCAGCVPGLGLLARILLSQPRLMHRRRQERCGIAHLVHPAVRERAAKDQRVSLLEYDIFDPWPLEKVAAVKIANVLNKAYFCDERLRTALKNAASCINQQGRIFVVDNRAVERITVLERLADGTLAIADVINGGAEAVGCIVTSGQVPGVVLHL